MDSAVFVQLLFEAAFGHVKVNFVPLAFDSKGKVFHDLFDAFFGFFVFAVPKGIDYAVAAKGVASLINMKALREVFGRADLDPFRERIVRNYVKVSAFHSWYNFL